ncbi:hypothetical protein NEOLEDRAFT_1125904 [Neolentinus lepideus HHB14362 ss-1]|uniref:LIM zinc-binding domain-containing protein n=1 Tax=Neolentinus lepideus HHB14362 ss-1 TaxID=1314782 RepID=A0A165VYC9_9AGAM|nr:hypothetical protein NEOLEDRAFT_1125904 [Neolentinus lepideus HHB14362 ss-1]
MGFCRRCGDIVVGERCKCGGTAVAPTIQWNQSGAKEDDRWSRTYVIKDKDPSPTGPLKPDTTGQTSASNASNSTARFLRPTGKKRVSTLLSSGVSHHIASTTAPRPPSPLKRSSTLEDSPSSTAAKEGILQCPNTGELSKAYGSVLQPSETLAKFMCHICSTPFPPDATIYPDPSSSPPTVGAGTRFLCRLCFTTNGGSKGDCVACGRAVLLLKSEGGFVENSGRLWHKLCFRCEGCFKNVGDKPMVDLLGRPSCVDCFDSCLKRSTNRTPQKPQEPASSSGKRNNLGGTSSARSREGTPALEELEQRLGILRSRDGSPVVEEKNRKQSIGTMSTLARESLGQGASRYSMDSRESSPFLDRVRLRTFSDLDTESEVGSALSHPSSYDLLKSPPDKERYSTPMRSRTSSSASSKPTAEAIEEMKNRFLRTSLSSPQSALNDFPSSTAKLSSSPATTSFAKQSPTLRRYSSKIPRSSNGLRTSLSSSPLMKDKEKDIEGVITPRTPDLMSDLSDDLTSVRSSGPSTPSTSPPRHRDDLCNPKSALEDILNTTPTTKLNTTPTAKPKPSPAPVVIPATVSSETTCAKCGLSLFSTHGGGKYVTVPEEPSSTGIPPKMYHTECFRCKVCDGPFQEKDGGQAVFVRAQGGTCHMDCAPPDKVTIKTMSSRIPITASTTVTATYSIPTKFERPPATAPASTIAFPRWGSSSTCPGCHKAVSPMEIGVVPGPQGSRWHATCLVCGGKDAKRRSMRSEERKPGCGKRLDSAAKSDGEGGVWCRECLLLSPVSPRSPESPTRPLVSQPTGSFWSSRGIVPQYTGTTTLARQFTGLSGGADAMARQLTGGGLSPTRQLTSSPTKQIGATPGRFPRPKSVIGMRSAKSVDEGRGMFLVRQMTGGGRL